ncbi:TonB-dependent receptor plug domain-containing protein [Tabrizicola sp.]|uniref:TonB-dependent receptor plug domain-containing protein n=1 Tax=Tabrizicola sp. TaxID=2005166 RepID=UPI003D2CDCE7
MKRLNISLIALLSMLAIPAQAQDIELDEIIVSAFKTAIERIRTGVSVSVVNPTADAAPARAVDTLNRLPGVSVSTQGALGSAARLRIRGADQRYIAVFVDGIRVTDPTAVQTEYDFGTLPSASIGRIEVLRGSQSALWGGSAVGGVVNIETPRATEDGTTQSVQAEAGRYATRSLSYGLAHKAGALETTLNLSHFVTDGYSAFDGGTEADGAQINRVSATLRYQVNGTLALGGALFHQRASNEFDGYNNITYAFEDQANSQKRDETGVRVFADLSLGNTQHVFDLTRYQVGREITDDNGFNTFDGTRTTFGWQATTELAESLTLVYGADTMLEEAEYSRLTGGIADTRISGAFGQALWAVNGQLDVSATVRMDNHSTFGNFETGRLSMAYRPDGATTLRGAIATGFRAPSIDELFGDYPTQAFIGNPGLTPEESLSYELGVEREFGAGAVVSATLFKLDVENQIAYDACPAVDPANWDFSCQPGTINTLNNIPGTSVRKGLELAAEMPLGDRANLGLAYTYTDAKRQTGARIGLVPRHELTMTLQGEITDRIRAGATVKHVADRLNDFAFAAMPDYTVVGVDASYQVNDMAEAYLRIENLFDEDYQTSEGYGTSGRAAFVGLRAKF